MLAIRTDGERRATETTGVSLGQQRTTSLVANDATDGQHATDRCADRDACTTDGEKTVTAALGHAYDDEHGGDGRRDTERLGYRGHTRRADSNESSGRFDGNFSTVFRTGAATTNGSDDDGTRAENATVRPRDAPT